MEVLALIWRVLLLGPLLYHFADMPNEPSIELGYAELKNVILSLNFEIIVRVFFDWCFTQDGPAYYHLGYTQDCPVNSENTKIRYKQDHPML